MKKQHQELYNLIKKCLEEGTPIFGNNPCGNTFWSFQIESIKDDRFDERGWWISSTSSGGFTSPFDEPMRNEIIYSVGIPLGIGVF